MHVTCPAVTPVTFPFVPERLSPSLHAVSTVIAMTDVTPTRPVTPRTAIAC
jgi:hypothetical protein